MSDSLIPKPDYKILSDDYADAWDAVVSSNDYLYNAVITVVDLDVLYPEVDLLNPFYQSYLLSVSQIQTPSSLLDAVRSLNTHVLVRGPYRTLNDYYAAANQTAPALKAKVMWQYLSAEAGYDISDTYLEP
jgi:hypothetical protein